VSSPRDLVAINADVDTEAVLSAIDREILRKREAGAYPQEVLDEPTPPDPSDDGLAPGSPYTATYSAHAGLPGGVGADPFALTHLVAEVNEVAYITPEVTTASEKALIAPVVARTKRLIQKTVRWYLTGIVDQMNDFANASSVTMEVMAQRIASLTEEVERLNAKLEKLAESRPREEED
jgi:hypothetical protein